MLLLHRVAYPVQKEGNLGAIKAQQLFKLAASLLAPGARFYGVTGTWIPCLFLDLLVLTQSWSPSHP